MSRVVTVFRNRLVESSRAAYGTVADEMSALARTMPGFVDAKTFTADDGERVTVVTFADRASHEGWRDHPLHREAMDRGRDEFYETYSIQVADETYRAEFER